MTWMMIETAWQVGKAVPGRMARAVLDFALPPRCVICSDAVIEHNALCAGCWSKLEFIEPPRCDVYGTPLPFDSGGRQLSAAAAQHMPAWDRARAAVKFDDHSRKVVHALKYHDRHEVVKLMSGLMRRGGGELLDDADLLVPVPLYWGECGRGGSIRPLCWLKRLLKTCRAATGLICWSAGGRHNRK